MATTVDYMEYVCDQIQGSGDIRYKKMFGEYMLYVNNKPLFTVCNNTVYVKKHPCIADKMSQAECGAPYPGAKEHYILNIEDADFCREIVALLEPVVPLPKPRRKKS